MSRRGELDRVVWATRGRSYGFRFLLDAGLNDPLEVYEAALAGVGESSLAFARHGDVVAVRFPDPQGRRDESGRVIPHEFVVIGGLAQPIDSVEDGLRILWPLVGAAYARIWDLDTAPVTSDLQFDP